MDITKIDLNRPAFGEDAQKVEELSEENPKPAEELKQEVETEEETPASEEEGKVTYSRFKNVWQRAKDAEARAEQAAHEAEELRSRLTYREPAKEQENADLPSWWIKLYGDSQESEQAWKIQKQANDEFQTRVIEEARERAIEALKSERYEEERRIESNIETIDDGLEQLEAYVGRDLSEKEQSNILDIVDEFTPKDEDGNYLGSPISFEKAWEIYEMKSNASRSPKSQARNAVAALSSSQSAGETEIGAEKNKNFNPFDWDAYKRRI